MPEVELIKWIGLAFLFILLGSAALRILTGGVRTKELIAGTTSNGSRFLSGARVQLLIMTLLAAAQYLSQVWQSPQKLPDIPQSWLLLLGGSHAVYLGTKFSGKRNKRFDI
jgi:hypothetical protein